ncbi:MAG: ABC transporter permease [Acidobacteriota bacterium]
MRIWEAVRMAAGSLRAHKLRSVLTLIGVIIGVVAVVIVMSLIAGLNLHVTTKVADMGSNTFGIDKFGLITDFKQYLAALKRNKDLTLDDMRALRESAPLLEEVGAQTDIRLNIKYRDLEMREIVIQGATANMLYLDTSQQVDLGRYLNASDVEHKRNVCFIGSDIAKRLYTGVDPLDKELKINGIPFQVIGIAKENGSIFGQSEDVFVVIPISTFQKMYGSRESIFIRARGRQDVPIEQAQDQARLLLRARHHLKFNDPDDFGIISAEAIKDLWQQLTGILAAVAVGITSISLVVGGIVIMNIMLVAVTERTREIGVRKSLGARRRDILWQFLAESVLMSGSGGLIGLLIAYLATMLITTSLQLPFIMPLSAVILAISVSMGVGLIFGIYPAWKAARLDPIVALRQE